MLFLPKKNTNKKSFKLKKKLKFKNPLNFNFGNSGIVLLNTYSLKSTNMVKFLLIFKKVIRRSKKNLRYFWLNMVFSFSKTYKVKGSRMGKGKGKIAFWVSRLSIGKFLVEFFNVRLGRVSMFLKKLKTILNTNLFLKFKKIKWILV